MHEGELATSRSLVEALLRGQLPHLAGLPVRQVRPTGTVNAVYRVGDRLCARLPRVPAWADDLERELRFLPLLAPRLPLQVPEPVARGVPGEGYPLSWAVYGWISGEPYADGLVDDEQRAARDLAAFVRALRAVEPVTGAPRTGRRPLHELDDPAADVVPAWSVFSRSGRAAYREALEVDDGTWERARGYALHQAVLIVPYYARTHPGFVATAQRTIGEVLDDVS